MRRFTRYRRPKYRMRKLMLSRRFTSFPYMNKGRQHKVNVKFNFHHDQQLTEIVSVPAQRSSHSYSRFSNITYNPWNLFTTEMTRYTNIFEFWKLNCVVIRFSVDPRHVRNLAAGDNMDTVPVVAAYNDTRLYDVFEHSNLRKIYYLRMTHPNQESELPTVFDEIPPSTGTHPLTEEPMPNASALKYRMLKYNRQTQAYSMAFKVKHPNIAASVPNTTFSTNLNFTSTNRLGFLRHGQQADAAIPWFSKYAFWFPMWNKNVHGPMDIMPFISVDYTFYLTFAGRRLVGTTIS